MTNRGSKAGLVAALSSVAIAVGAGVVVNMASSEVPVVTANWAATISLILASLASLGSLIGFRRKERQRTRLVFIVHAHADKYAASQVSEALRNRGYDTWLDSEALVPGMDWKAEMASAIAKASAAVVIVSSDLSDSFFATREMRSLMSNVRTKDPSIAPLIPVLVGQAKIPVELQQIQGIRLDDPAYAEKLDFSLARILDGA